MKPIQKIFFVQMRVDPDNDVWAYVSVQSEDGTEVETHLTEEDLNDLIAELRNVKQSMTWHRTTWVRTWGGRMSHLARKGDERVLCGTSPGHYVDGWDFTPYFGNIDPSEICKRCAVIYQKAATQP